MDIRILPSNIANQIAAGEVVQRPASVVKELVENAVDAGADQVTVVIHDAGRTLIQVIDNGCGMSPDQAVLCFERHATSKIATAEDLQRILTFGFRGEALASIAAVAEVTLKTRREEDEVGCQVDYADSQHIDTIEVATPRGANFSVRNLFYNVPARRKFLKSDNVEFKHIVSEFTRIALTRPETGFTLTHNGKDIYVLRPAKSLKFRIQDMLGTNMAKELADVSAHTSLVDVYGFIGRPDAARKGLGNQYFFVNGRYFRSPYLHKAVMKAYENLIPEGVTPSYFIYLDIDPQSVDVNIHPTKTEIKFEDDSVVFQILFACIKEALGKNSFGASIDFDREGMSDIPVFSRDFEEFRSVQQPVEGLDPTYNPFENDGFPSEPALTRPSQPSAGHAMPVAGGLPTFEDWSAPEPSYPSGGSFPPGTSRYTSQHDDYGKLFEDKVMPTKSVLILQGKYIITTSRSGLMVIHAVRAMERILYERFLKALSGNSHVTQTALFPVTVQVGVENMCLFEEHQQMLAGLGFDIAPFGTDTVVVNGVPEGFSAEAGKVQGMVNDLLLVLAEDHNALSEMMTANMSAGFAKLGALSSDSVTNPMEAQRLIDQLFACENSEFTANGRRIITLVPVDEIERKF
ncbi:MAG: DNA mismatch repair endonuclease MutL [Bacteroidales bacterium]|nr:DNA mismatch repair endonuclease MutL [Bacteroidales bacterium]